MDMSWLERVPKSSAMVQVMRKSTVFDHRKYLDIPLIHGKSVVFVQTWVQINRPGGILQFVHLSLLTLINPNQLCEVLVFVCSKMADQTNLSSKLPVADRTREVWERKLCGEALALAFCCTRFYWASLILFASYSPAPLLMRPRLISEKFCRTPEETYLSQITWTFRHACKSTYYSSYHSYPYSPSYFWFLSE